MAGRPYNRAGSTPLTVVAGGGRARSGMALLEERVRTIVEGLGGTYNIELAMPATTRAPPRLVGGGVSKAPQPTIASVFHWFVHGTKDGTRQPARNVLAITPGAARNLIDTVVTKYAERASAGDVPTLGQLAPGVAYAWRAILVGRLEAGGGDLHLAALSAAHRARKLRLGYPAKIGTMTGQTLEAVRRAQPIIRRVR